MKYEAIGKHIILAKNQADHYVIGRYKDDVVEPHHLYDVCIVIPVGVFCISVLAESEQGAIDQARSWLHLEEYMISKELNKHVYAFAEKSPLLLRGWSDREF